MSAYDGEENIVFYYKEFGLRKWDTVDGSVEYDLVETENGCTFRLNTLQNAKNVESAIKWFKDEVKDLYAARKVLATARYNEFVNWTKTGEDHE